MRLFPRLVMLLACVPLLLPPGLCACGASETSAAPTRANADAGAKPNRCGCRHHTTPASPATLHVSPAPHDPAHPHHAPGCPATADGSKWVERAEPVGHLAPLALDALPTFGLTLADTRVAAPAPTGMAAPPHFPPLYLTHCALLI